MRSLRLADKHVRTATTEESALAIRSDIDIDEAGHGRAGGLNPLHFEAMLAKCPAEKVAEFVLADASNKARWHTPARKRENGIGSDSAEMHFEVRRKAIVAGFGPPVDGSKNVHVDVTENDDCIAKGHGWRSLSLPKGRKLRD
jgi:hypothetical protein